MKILPGVEAKVVAAERADPYKVQVLLVVVGLMVASVVVTNVIGVKIMTLFGFTFTAGVITFAATFMTTDIVSEIWGRKTANFAVLLGFAGNLLMVFFVWLAVISPPAPFWEGQEAYEVTLGAVPRIVFASMIAYVVSQLHDVWAFHMWRSLTKGKYLWLRNNLSTFTSQVIDTTLFILIAFGLQFGLAGTLSLMFAQFMVKWLLAVVDTAVIYPIVALIGPPVEGAHPTYD